MDPEIIEIKRYRNSVFKEQNSLVHSRPDQGAAGPGAQLGRGALFCIQLNPAITDPRLNPPFTDAVFQSPERIFLYFV